MCSIEDILPNLPPERYTPHSPADSSYNCFAFVIGWENIWVEPAIDSDIGFSNLYYWPSNIPEEHTLEAFIEFYRSHRYELCTSSDYEDGFTKIAIYVDLDARPIHAAKQLKDGTWASKILDVEDILHEEPNSLIEKDGVLGNPAVYLRRRCQ